MLLNLIPHLIVGIAAEKLLNGLITGSKEEGGGRVVAVVTGASVECHALIVDITLRISVHSLTKSTI